MRNIEYIKCLYIVGYSNKADDILYYKIKSVNRGCTKCYLKDMVYRLAKNGFKINRVRGHSMSDNFCTPMRTYLVKIAKLPEELEIISKLNHRVFCDYMNNDIFNSL